MVGLPVMAVVAVVVAAAAAAVKVLLNQKSYKNHILFVKQKIFEKKLEESLEVLTSFEKAQFHYTQMI